MQASLLLLLLLLLLCQHVLMHLPYPVHALLRSSLCPRLLLCARRCKRPVTGSRSSCSNQLIEVI
jgi:hypothetical protein